MHNQILSNLNNLINSNEGNLSFNLGDREDNADLIKSIYETVKDVASKTLGEPAFSDTRNNYPNFSLQFRKLHGSFSQSYNMSYWDKEEYIVTAMLTSHDAGSLIFLEIEKIAKTTLLN